MKKWNMKKLAFAAGIENIEDYEIFHGFNELFNYISPWDRDGMTNTQIKKLIRNEFENTLDNRINFGELIVIYFGHCYHFFY